MCPRASVDKVKRGDCCKECLARGRHVGNALRTLVAQGLVLITLCTLLEDRSLGNTQPTLSVAAPLLK